jgi:hypothetical protein
VKSWLLKSCPKCSGDLFIEKDLHGWYRECLQCGRISSISSFWGDVRNDRDRTGRRQLQVARAGR